MAKQAPAILVVSDTGPQIIEGDVANITQSGLLLIGMDHGTATEIVAGFVPGSWRSFKKLDKHVVLN